MSDVTIEELMDNVVNAAYHMQDIHLSDDASESARRSAYHILTDATNAVLAAYEQQRKELEGAREALKMVEWIENGCECCSRDVHFECPWCHQWYKEHAADCPRQKALGEA